MFGKIFKRKKKKKKPDGKITSMTVNGEPTKVRGLRVYAGEDGSGKLQIFCSDVTEALHFEQSDLVIKTGESKTIKMKVRFEGAEKDKKLYKYNFAIEDYNETFA